ncbi:DUF2513 domain-containing protein [Chamaesiphon polymorphus]|uniref:DUF2513 domain-containing protein n=1 Tax=Chamaesiphon polymorphus CCALA 037 TaxID=2107692 RepID=A0A2T1F7A3_9CYAN|nr:DUF2513 domain-containing protein [Chamaesiphon polymorphus]PSB40887.1 hypothetical protein C7B77_27890 [Chamaesiphon polymorphus CCALA 037]
MKRDLELIRQLMLAIESNGDDFDAESIEIDGYDSSQINYHLQLLIEAKLAVGEVHTFFNSDRPTILIEKLSWEGCNFLDDARNESVWQKTMEIVKDKGGSVSVGVLTQLLTSVAKQLVGLV